MTRENPTSEVRVGGINSRRVWIGGLLGFVAWAAWSAVTNMVVLGARYPAAAQAGQMLQEPRYRFFAVAWFAILLLLSWVAAWLYAGVRATYGPGPGTAIKVGALLGFAAGFPMAFVLAAWATFDRVFPLWWMLQLWVGAVLAALVAGWTYRER